MEPAVRSVYAKLKVDWMGNKVGHIVRLPPRMAEDLFRRDAAELVPIESNDDVREKMQGMVRNKMVRRSSNK